MDKILEPFTGRVRTRRRQWAERKRCALLLFAVCECSMLAQQVGAFCPSNNTMTSFERIGSVAIKDMALTLLYSAPNVTAGGGGGYGSGGNLRPGYASMEFGTGGSMQSTGGGGGPAAASITPITAECNNRCRKMARCRAFLVDYARQTCYSVEQSPHHLAGSSSPTGLVRAPPPITLVPTQERTSYFEKVCLNVVPDCERAWVYERVMGHHLHGYDDRVIDDVPSRLKCQEYCLTETDFKCRSGEYDYVSMQCRLSMVDRHLKPNAFRPTANNVDYFENQCVPVGNQCDAFDQYENMDLGRAEIMRSANTSDQCQQICTQTTRAFICRSFTWNPLTGKCYLNSANSFMVGGLDRLIRAPGLVYQERNDCVDLKLECDTTAMTLNLRTNEPFRGRMYVRDDPNGCETMGRSALTSTLSIPFQSHTARCAVRELPNRFSSVVVVQKHPMIQRKSDRYIKVVCDFQTSNRTITSSYNVVNSPWASTALINATSFAPKIKLRITDRFGTDIAGAKLGDELFLRIEAETESVYDMVARSVMAKSGMTTDESIMLIDKDGCPTDWRIFPALKKLNRRTIVGKFDAFKFSSDVVVRFQVDVQFCLNQCPSTSCDSSNLLLNAQQLTGNEPSSNYDSSQLQQQQQQQVSHATSSSPLASSHSPAPQSPLNSLSEQHPADSSLVTASFGSPTQAPASQVPFQQRTQLMAGPSSLSSLNSMNSLNSMSSMTGSEASNNNNYSQKQQYQPPSQADNYWKRHPSMPANSPQNSYLATGSGGAPMPPIPNFTSNPQLGDLHTPTSDPQIFEQAQPRSAPQTAADQPSMKSMAGPGEQKQPQTGSQRLKQQQLASNSIGEGSQAQDGLAGDSGNQQQQQATSNSQQQQSPQEQQDAAAAGANRLRRKRRSAEPMPKTPSHVPLQREIIVESAPVSDKRQTGSGGPPHQEQAAGGRRSAKSASGAGPRLAKSGHDAKADGLNRNGPAYDLNGNQNNKQTDKMTQDELQHQPDNGTLLCTTRNSLVILAMAFCTVQLFTIAMCLVTWLHRRADSKFKVRHPVEQRLY